MVRLACCWSGWFLHPAWGGWWVVCQWRTDLLPCICCFGITHCSAQGFWLGLFSPANRSPVDWMWVDGTPYNRSGRQSEENEGFIVSTCGIVKRVSAVLRRQWSVEHVTSIARVRQVAASNRLPFRAWTMGLGWQDSVGVGGPTRTL